jgi:hypothetical protein
VNRGQNTVIVVGPIALQRLRVSAQTLAALLFRIHNAHLDLDLPIDEFERQLDGQSRASHILDRANNGHRMFLVCVCNAILSQYPSFTHRDKDSCRFQFWNGPFRQQVCSKPSLGPLRRELARSPQKRPLSKLHIQYVPDDERLCLHLLHAILDTIERPHLRGPNPPVELFDKIDTLSHLVSHGPPPRWTDWSAVVSEFGAHYHLDGAAPVRVDPEYWQMVVG